MPATEVGPARGEIAGDRQRAVVRAGGEEELRDAEARQGFVGFLAHLDPPRPVEILPLRAGEGSLPQLGRRGGITAGDRGLREHVPGGRGLRIEGSEREEALQERHGVAQFSGSRERASAEQPALGDRRKTHGRVGGSLREQDPPRRLQVVALERQPGARDLDEAARGLDGARGFEELLGASPVAGGGEGARGDGDRFAVLGERSSSRDERQGLLDDLLGEVELDRLAPAVQDRACGDRARRLGFAALREEEERRQDHRNASARTTPSPSRIQIRRPAGPALSCSTRPDGHAIRIAL